MDFRKLDRIETPQEWIEPIIDLEKNEKLYIDSFGKNKIMQPGLRAVVIVIVCLLVFGTGITVAATSNPFRTWLTDLFGAQKVSEVQLQENEKKNSNADNKVLDGKPADNDVTDSKTIKMGEDELFSLQENTMVMGEKESFISEYHLVGDKEIVDHVYKVQGDVLEQLPINSFEGEYDGVPFSFEYATINKEIYGFNYTGEMNEVFHYVNENVVYADVCHIDKKKDIYEKECIVALDLKTKKITKLSNDQMICNFVMSPDGKVILCNHRSEGYWSVFDISTRKEKKVKDINGYAHTDEIVFLDDYHIVVLGESLKKGGVDYSTYKINLRTQKKEKVYKDYGEINMQWSYIQENGDLQLNGIINNESFLIKNVRGDMTLMEVRGDYLLFGDVDHENMPYYIVNLAKKTHIKIDIPKELRTGVEIHLVTNEKKILMTNGVKAYLVDVSKL